jgi:pimeloyl-ACP methyl ester carboxylesterase
MNANKSRLLLYRASSTISLIVLAMISALPLHGQDAPDTTKHTVQFVSVEENVKLEVLDWGGSGHPMIFLAGMGDTAHVFDKFAPAFTAKHHVYGITRRGFGASSKPVPDNGNYMSDRLGDDVLAIMNHLKIDRPILVGHSLAGEELSSVGSRFPERVAGLIYLEAGYGSAYYDSSHSDMVVDMNDLKGRIDQLESGKVQDEKQFLLDLASIVSRFEKSLDEGNKRMQSLHSPPPRPPIIAAISYGAEKYTKIPVPVLAIFAVPRNWDRVDPAARAARVAADLAYTSAQANAFEAGVPTARVVRLPNADHDIFISNEADVLREMNDFLTRVSN